MLFIPRDALLKLSKTTMTSPQNMFTSDGITMYINPGIHKLACPKFGYPALSSEFLGKRTEHIFQSCCRCATLKIKSPFES